MSCIVLMKRAALEERRRRSGIFQICRNDTGDEEDEGFLLRILIETQVRRQVEMMWKLKNWWLASDVCLIFLCSHFEEGEEDMEHHTKYISQV